jgi:hypothetical protein
MKKYRKTRSAVKNILTEIGLQASYECENGCPSKRDYWGDRFKGIFLKGAKILRRLCMHLLVRQCSSLFITVRRSCCQPGTG